MPVLLFTAMALGLSVLAPHPKCTAMDQYQASYVNTTYDINRHMGKYYELAFRDLYPGPPMCDCEHTEKIFTNQSSYYEEFDFKCGHGSAFTPCLNLINMTQTGPHVGVYQQTITGTSVDGLHIPGLFSASFKTAAVAFKESASADDDQYEWVIEFTCGDSSPLLNLAFPGGFVGLNFYSKSGPLSSTNMQEMVAETNALGLGWAMDSWGVGFHVVPHNTSCTY